MESEIHKTMIQKRDINICIAEFEKFYALLMQNAPEGYSPWFFPCEKNGKNPSPEAIFNIDHTSKGSWHHDSARLDYQEVIEHIKMGYNIGISARKNDSLIIGDIDEIKFIEQLPKGTLTTTSRKRVGCHFFGWNKDGSAKINLPTDSGEIRSDNQYVLASGSYVPFNLEDKKDKEAFDKLPEEAKNDPLLGYYSVRDANFPRPLTFTDFPKFFQEKQKENLDAESSIKQREEARSYNAGGKYSDLFKLKVSDIVGLIPAKERHGHPLHESDTDANFSLSKDGTIAHCWRHMVSLNAVQYLCVKAGYSKCEDAGTPHKNNGISKIRGDRKALEVAYAEAVKIGLIKEYKGAYIKDMPESIFGKLGQAREFHKKNPYVFDRAGIFWIWNQENRCYKQSDKTDVLNNIRNVLLVDTIDSKSRNEIIASLEQVGRENLPKDVPSNWIQFKRNVVDIKTGEVFEANPEYFFTSPIPWDIGESDETPVLDRLFKEWVVKDRIQDESYVRTLQEVTAYASEDSAFMQTIVWLCGSGCNGKGSYLNFLMKFLGLDNVTSSELKTLVTRNFETSALYKKKAVVMGEVDTYDLTNTNLLKQLSGEDLIRFEFKGKTPFSQKSTTTCFVASNSLPVTPDRSNGFYRRNLIIDFPNVFSVGKDIIGDIPEEEYRNFARKSLNILRDLHERGTFTNGGTIEERKIRYEERSNPIIHFIKSKCSESPEDYQVFSVFLSKFQEYLKENRLRPMSAIQTSKALKMEGYDLKNRHVRINYGTPEQEEYHVTCIYGLKLL